MDTTNEIKSDVKRTAKKAAYNPVMETLERVGYGVRGFIYITMGLLSLSVALGKGGTVVDPQGAIAAIGRQPAGLVLLWVVLIGLVSYSLWGLIRAVLDPLQKGHDLKGVITRIAYLISAVSYALLVLPTYGFISGAGSSTQSGAQSQDFLASILSKSWGHLAIGAIGVIVIAAGLYQVYQGFNSSFDKQFQTYAMTAREVKWATQLGRFGTAIRGFIFALVGVLLFQAATQSGSSQKIGIDSALNSLLHQPYGVWLLGIVALGFMAFGLFSVLSGVWFRAKR